MTASTLSLNQTATRSDDVLFQEVGGEAVLLDLASEQYFGLDPVGTRIWQLLEKAPALQAVADTLHTEFEVEPSRMESDLLAIIDKLAAAGLVRLV